MDLEVVGRRAATPHRDAAAAAFLSSPEALVSWSSDPSLLIDRHDVRHLLDRIPPAEKHRHHLVLDPVEDEDACRSEIDLERYLDLPAPVDDDGDEDGARGGGGGGDDDVDDDSPLDDAGNPASNLAGHGGAQAVSFAYGDNVFSVDSDRAANLPNRIASNLVRQPNTNDTCEEMVLEMEEILLESGNSHRQFAGPAKEAYARKQSHPFRDGSSTASTSGTDEASLLSKVDWVEVVGAKQKKGDVSFGERLVGVKEYTAYQLRVWSGNDQWEIERRYRDFFAFYKQLKLAFCDRGLTLPSEWSNVDRESKKFFGNASPNVVSERSALIQSCLHSLLRSRLPLGASRILAYFLSPSGMDYNSGLLKALSLGLLLKPGDGSAKFSYSDETSPEVVSPMGKTITLVVELKPSKSIIQLLEAQHYLCAGCHTHLNAGKTLWQEVVNTINWKKPRICEYTGQLFCTACHTNDTAVLPAKVLHLWDFSLYPVSQIAKAYLESIYDQPMLCVSAVNPLLFSKVPTLLHVMSIRKKIAAMFPYLGCPFRGSIERGLGYRRHLLEGNDFFALRDLVDLSKGAFSALPVLVENVSSKIFEHITQQCLVCCDAGVPCAARQDCDDPSSFIFPFQEADAVKCGSCGSIFHKTCLGKGNGCSCGNLSGANSVEEAPTGQVTRGTDGQFYGVMARLAHPADSISGIITNLFSKATPEKLLKSKNDPPVILMSSLPSTSL